MRLKPAQWNWSRGATHPSWAWFVNSAQFYAPLWERAGYAAVDLISGKSSNGAVSTVPTWQRGTMTNSQGTYLRWVDMMEGFGGTTSTLVLRMRLSAWDTNGSIPFSLEQPNYWQLQSAATGIEVQSKSISVIDISGYADNTYRTWVLTSGPKYGTVAWSNGRRLGSSTISTTSMPTTPKDVVVGDYIGSLDGAFVTFGDIDFVSFHDSEFSPAEVRQITADPFGPLRPDLGAWMFAPTASGSPWNYYAQL